MGATLTSCLIFLIMMLDRYRGRDYFWSVFLFTGMIAAMLIGESNKSRAFIALSLWLVGAIVAVILHDKCGIIYDPETTQFERCGSSS